MPTPVTVVRCSCPGCSEPASLKIAAPWIYGNFRELKTYGFACAGHTKEVEAHARNRPKPQHLSPGESVGELAAFNIPGAAS